MTIPNGILGIIKYIDDLQGNKCIHHEGKMNGFIAQEKYFPNEDTYVAILTNVKSSEETTEFSINRFRLFENISLLAINKEIRKSFAVSNDILDSHVGVYQFATAKNRTIKISREKDYLIGQVSGQGKYLLLFKSDTKFSFEGIIDATCEFVKENGKKTKIIFFQNGQFIWNKIN